MCCTLHCTRNKTILQCCCSCTDIAHCTATAAGGTGPPRNVSLTGHSTPDLSLSLGVAIAQAHYPITHTNPTPSLRRTTQSPIPIQHHRSGALPNYSYQSNTTPRSIPRSIHRSQDNSITASSSGCCDTAASHAAVSAVLALSCRSGQPVRTTPPCPPLSHPPLVP